MKHLSLLTLFLAALSLIFVLIIVFLRIAFPLYPLVSYQDVFGLLPPLIFIPLYWVLFRRTAQSQTGLGREIVFMLLAALWIEGQGIHLAANSIDNLIEALARSQVLNIKTTDIYQLTYFLDEHLSHYLMHFGMLGLAVLLIYHELRYPAGSRTLWWAAVLAGSLYGFFNFCTFLEGQTVVIGLPASLIIVLFALLWGRKQLSQRPILAFFFVTFLVALLLLAGWGLRWGGFPQFSEVGLL